MTCTQITQLLYINKKIIRILLDISLELYCQDRSKFSIVSFKVLDMIGT